jgi:hypothetical protein
MDPRLRRLLVDSVLLFGLALFAVGATVLVLDYPFPVGAPVLGALAFLFVGCGVALKRRVQTS